MNIYEEMTKKVNVKNVEHRYKKNSGIVVGIVIKHQCYKTKDNENIFINNIMDSSSPSIYVGWEKNF